MFKLNIIYIFYFSSGPVHGPAKMQHIIDKNQDILNSFLRAIDELNVLRENLVRKEVRVISFLARKR